MTTVYVQLGEFTVPIDVTERAEEVSGHTGRTLLLLRGSTTNNDETVHEKFLSALKKQPAEGVALAARGPAAAVAPERRWRLTLGTHSYTLAGNGRPARYTYSLELREAERLVPDRLELTDGEGARHLKLTPYRYAEELSSGALLIRCRVRVAGEESEALRRLILDDPDYFNVTRPGVSDTPRRMRFGQITWSHHDDGDKYSLYFIEEAYDRAKPNAKRGIRLTDSAARRHVAYQAEVLKGLLDRLEAKGILDTAEVSGIQEEAAQAAVERAFNVFSQKVDIDADDAEDPDDGLGEDTGTAPAENDAESSS